jgi:hypothetical protein
MKRGEKSQTVIALMETNRDKPYLEVAGLIEKTVGCTNKAARAYYQYMVHNGKVTGIQLDFKSSKVAKAKAPKDIHAASNRLIAKALASGKLDTAKVALEKSAADIASIKAKNLETMKKVSAKTKKVKVIDTSAAEVATVDLSDEDVYADRELIKGLVPKEFHKSCGLA